MAKDDQDIGRGDDPYFAGDSLELPITVEEDGSVKDISGWSSEWALSETPGGSELVNEADSGVDVTITDGPNGEVTVTVDAGVTDGLSRNYHHELRLTDTQGNKGVVTRGTIYIETRVNL